VVGSGAKGRTDVGSPVDGSAPVGSLVDTTSVVGDTVGATVWIASVGVEVVSRDAVGADGVEASVGETTVASCTGAVPVSVVVAGGVDEVSGAGVDGELVAPASVDVGVDVGAAVESVGAFVTTGVVSVEFVSVFVAVVVVSWSGSAISASSPQ
jgi:hypothetical protein